MSLDSYERSKEKPTTPGHYWYRLTEQLGQFDRISLSGFTAGRWEMLCLFYYGGDQAPGLYVQPPRGEDYICLLSEWPDGEWVGPIEEPK